LIPQGRFMLSKRFVVSFVGSLGLLLSSAAALAVAPDERVPYYGSELYERIHHSEILDASKLDLKTLLYPILKNPHIVQSGVFDRIVAACPGRLDGNQRCVERQILSYEGARRKLFGQLFLKEENGEYLLEDVYCQRFVGRADFSNPADAPGPDKIPLHTVINCEHTWPQSRFNGNEHRESQKTDLHHLFPTDSKMNGVRGNHPFGEVVKGGPGGAVEQKCAGNYLGTPMAVAGVPSPGRSPFYEVPVPHRGNLARALFYFAVRYRANMSPTEEHYMRKWHEEDPVDAAERRLNDQIYAIQGTRNPFIDHPSFVGMIASFASEAHAPVSGGASDDDAPRPPRSGKPDRPSTPSNPSTPSDPVNPAVLAPHTLTDSTLSVMDANGKAIHVLKEIVEARRNPCAGIPSRPYNSYELFARDGKGTLFRFKGNAQKTQSTEKVGANVTLNEFFAAKGINCQAP